MIADITLLNTVPARRLQAYYLAPPVIPEDLLGAESAPLDGCPLLFSAIPALDKTLSRFPVVDLDLSLQHDYIPPTFNISSFVGAV
jgi:hypothetical protein